jgi:hypothetical protein
MEYYFFNYNINNITNYNYLLTSIFISLTFMCKAAHLEIMTQTYFPIG